MALGTAETSVRMGEWAASARPGEVLSCVGLGSCIALVLTDLERGAVGLAHVVLPQGSGEPAAKYADTAVPELIAGTIAAGANRTSLCAALVGGAAMFAFEGDAADQIGARNERVVRATLASEQISIVDAVTGGAVGRSLRITAGDPVVATVRARAGTEVPIRLDRKAPYSPEIVSTRTWVEEPERAGGKTTTEVAN